MPKARITLAPSSNRTEPHSGKDLFEKICQALELSATGIAADLLGDPEAKPAAREMPPGPGERPSVLDPLAPYRVTIDVRLERAPAPSVVAFPTDRDPER